MSTIRDPGQRPCDLITCVYEASCIRLGHLRRGDERAAALTADDPSLDGGVVQRLADGRARDRVEALAESALGLDRRPRRHPVDLRPQPLPQLVVLRCADRGAGIDGTAVADDLREAAAVEGERLVDRAVEAQPGRS